MYRRQLLLLTGAGLTAGLAGCAGGGSDDGGATTQAPETTAAPASSSTATETSVETEAATDTETPTETDTPTPEPDPEFRVEIQAPDTASTGEAWSYSVLVINDGGEGTFTSPVSVRYGNSDWESTNSDATIRLDAGERGVAFRVKNINLPSPGEIGIRVDDVGVTETVTVEWGGVYDPDTIRDRVETVGYEELFRNISQYQGEAVHFEYGYVYQTLYNRDAQYAPYDYYQMEVSNSEEQYEGDIAANWYGDDRLLEEDIIELWGVVERLYEYETVQGDTRTIPLLTMTDYRLRN